MLIGGHQLKVVLDSHAHHGVRTSCPSSSFKGMTLLHVDGIQLVSSLYSELSHTLQ